MSNSFPPPSLRTMRVGSLALGILALAACSTAETDAARGDSATAAGALAAPGSQTAALNPADSSLITVYKTPTCGCCALWVDHMRANGFRVAVTDVAQIGPVKQTHGVPSDVATCHTGKIGNYFVEGHVPAEDVRRLMRERPDIIGIAVPGMPQGSPGMETGSIDTYDVYAIARDGSRKVWATHGPADAKPGAGIR